MQKLGAKIVTNQSPFHSFVLVVKRAVVLKNGGSFHHHVMFVLFAECSGFIIYLSAGIHMTNIIVAYLNIVKCKYKKVRQSRREDTCIAGSCAD